MILIAGAQIWQETWGQRETEHNLEHGFIIIEANHPHSGRRHVMYAESNAERDDWIDVLVRYAVLDEPPKPLSLPATSQLFASPHPHSKHNRHGYEQAIPSMQAQARADPNDIQGGGLAIDRPQNAPDPGTCK